MDQARGRRGCGRPGLFAALFIAALAATSCAVCSPEARSKSSALAGVERWWILIGDSNAFASIDWRHQTRDTEMVILNDDPRIPLGDIPASTLRLGYLSVGEVDERSRSWAQVHDRACLVEDDPNWPQNVRVDVRDKVWQELLLDKEVPRLLGMGFQGFMLDTMDTVPYLENKDPRRFAGSRQALRDWLALLRARYPKIVLLANGTAALVDAAPYVDGYVVEGVFATYDFARRTYRPTTEIERTWKLGRIADAQAVAGRPVFTIEYASVGDIALGQWAATESAGHGFRPYVTVKEINSLP